MTLLVGLVAVVLPVGLLAAQPASAADPQPSAVSVPGSFDSEVGCPDGSPDTCYRDNYTMYPLQDRFFENALEGLYQSTRDGRFLQTNPAFAAMLGYTTPAELIATINDISGQLYADPRCRAREAFPFALLGDLDTVVDAVASVDADTVAISARRIAHMRLMLSSERPGRAYRFSQFSSQRFNSQ